MHLLSHRKKFYVRALLLMVLITVAFWLAVDRATNLTDHYKPTLTIEFKEGSSPVWDRWTIYEPNQEPNTVLITKAIERTIKFIDDHDISLIFYFEPTQIFTGSVYSGLYIKDNRRKRDHHIETIQIPWPVFFGVRQIFIDKRNWQFYRMRLPGLSIRYLFTKTWIGKPPSSFIPRDEASTIKWREKETLAAYLDSLEPMFWILSGVFIVCLIGLFFHWLDCSRSA